MNREQIRHLNEKPHLNALRVNIYVCVVCVSLVYIDIISIISTFTSFICLPTQKMFAFKSYNWFFFLFLLSIYFSIADAIVEEVDIQLFSAFLSSLIPIDEWDWLKMEHFPPILLFFFCVERSIHTTIHNSIRCYKLTLANNALRKETAKTKNISIK